MRGYIPPYLPWSRSRIFPPDWPIIVGAQSYAIPGIGKVIPHDCEFHTPVAGSLATLLRWHLLHQGSGTWDDVSAECIEWAICRGLSIPMENVAVSFAQSLKALSIVNHDELPVPLQRFGRLRKDTEGIDGTERFPFSLDMILTVPRSRMMMKVALSYGVPLAMGLSIYESWHDARDVATGVVRVPDFADEPMDGDCVVLDGWDDHEEAFSCWFMAGSAWGNNGRGWLPYLYGCSPLLVHELVMIPYE